MKRMSKKDDSRTIEVERKKAYMYESPDGRLVVVKDVPMMCLEDEGGNNEFDCTFTEEVSLRLQQIVNEALKSGTSQVTVVDYS